MLLSVIYPVYNEQNALRSAIHRSVAALQELGIEWEIVIVDDGSTDATGRVAKQAAREFPRIKLVTNPINQGQGFSIARGVQAASGNVVIHNGADYPFDLRDLRLILPLIEYADIVVAERTAWPGYSPFRRIVSWLNALLVRLLFRLPVRDCNFVQLYRKPVWDAIPVTVQYAAMLPVEKLVGARARGYKIARVHVPYHGRQEGAATGGIAGVGKLGLLWRSTADLLRYWLRH